MVKKLNTLLNIIIGSTIGVLLGHSLFVCWEHHKHPDYYALQSAPWYTSILVYGFTTAAIILIAVVIKLVLKNLKKYQ